MTYNAQAGWSGVGGRSQCYIRRTPKQWRLRDSAGYDSVLGDWLGWVECRLHVSDELAVSVIMKRSTYDALTQSNLNRLETVRATHADGRVVEYKTMQFYVIESINNAAMSYASDAGWVSFYTSESQLPWRADDVRGWERIEGHAWVLV